MTNYSQDFRTRGPTPQTEPTPGREDEVEGRAGGYIFAVDDWTALDRFLILGSEAPTYYASSRELTIENCTVALRLIKADGPRVVQRVVEVSHEGRAASNDPALFILAMASAEGDLKTRKIAFEALPKVARIGTHLFHFVEYRKAFGGWGRMMKRAVGDWYLRQPVDKLAYQVIKYRQRDGWTHRDVLRKAHPKTDDENRNALFNWIISGEYRDEDNVRIPSVIAGFNVIQRTKAEDVAEGAIIQWNLPREAVPTEFLKSPRVWEALLYSGQNGMPLGALLRNLGNMSKVGLLAPMSNAANHVADCIVMQESLKKSRIHPYAILSALTTYAQGHGFRGSSEWKVVSTIVDALETALELSFDNIEPSGKRIMIGLDVSGSMASPIHNLAISAREAATVMALVTARSEPIYQIMAFAHEFVQLVVSKSDSFRAVVEATRNVPFMGTDCALPMLYAMGYKVQPGSAFSARGKYIEPRGDSNIIPVDAFIIYTDSETWAGSIKPFEALRQYRQKTGIDAKLIVVGMTSNGFTIADPTDGGMLDVVGFDTAAPSIIADFIR